METLYNFVKKIVSFELPPLLKFIFIFFSIFFGLVTVYFLLRSSFLKEFFLQDLIEFLTLKSYGKRKIAEKWSKIFKKLDSKFESDYKLAILEADSLLEKALERMGYQDKSLNEKLEKAADLFSDLPEIFEAHQIRENIIADPDYKISLGETKRILKIYQKALLNLEAI